MNVTRNKLYNFEGNRICKEKSLNKLSLSTYSLKAFVDKVDTLLLKIMSPTLLFVAWHPNVRIFFFMPLNQLASKLIPGIFLFQIGNKQRLRTGTFRTRVLPSKPR